MAIGADRAATVATLSGLHQLDVIISDDGLQHYAMARDFEILMVDANRLFGNRLMIPFGPLREPVARIGSVDYVIQNGENEIKLYGREKTTAIMNVGTLGLVNLQSNKTFPLSILKEGSVCAVAGIGNPQRFFNSLSFHCKDFKQLVFADHHNFNADDFYSIDDDMIVMTEKDAVKCREFAKANWYFLKIEAGLKAEDFNRLYNLIEKTLFKKA